jgi:hypothetical protein
MESVTTFKRNITLLLITAFLILSCEDSYYIEKDKEIKIISKNISGQDSSKNGPFLKKVVAVSKDKAWSCDSTGLMLLTLNEGNDWQDYDINEKINDILFVDENTGWIITDRKILFTDNACADFTLQKELKLLYYRDLSFLDIDNYDSEQISVALNTDYMAISTNKGKSWYFANIDSDIEFKHTIFPQENRAFYISDDAIVYNEIKNEKIINTKLDQKLNFKLNDIDNYKEFVWVSSRNQLFETNLEFLDFKQLYECQEGEEIVCIDMINREAGVLLLKKNEFSIIKITEDSGMSWEQLSESEEELYDIDFFDSNNGFAVGKNTAMTIKR